MNVRKKAVYAALLASCAMFAFGFVPGAPSRALMTLAFAVLGAFTAACAHNKSADGFAEPESGTTRSGELADGRRGAGLLPDEVSAELERALRERDEARARLGDMERSISAVSGALIPDMLSYLPLASAVIRSVPEKTEEAAFVVMDRFTVVKEATGAAASSARELRQDLENEASGRSIRREAEISRKTVSDEKSVIAALRSCTKENHEQLLAMGREIETGLDLLKNIEDITARSKLIAFNMSVEAARIGEKGAGFKVIILELHKLNDRTLDFSRKVTDVMRKFRQYNEALVHNMEVKAEAVVDSVERGINAAEGAVETLISASGRTEDFTRDIARMAESINRDMDGVLESMQFQDITRQMMEGAECILGELMDRIEGCMGSAGLNVDRRLIESRFAEIRERFVRAAKTNGEKSALMEVRI